MSKPTRHYWEISLLILTGSIHILIKYLPLNMRFGSDSLFGIDFIGNMIAVTLWSFYLIYRIVQSRTVLHDWGFRLDNLKPSGKICFLFGLPFSILLILYGTLYKGFHPPLQSILIILLIYPIWGLIQQFALQNFANKNLRELGISLAIRVPIVGLLFSLSHFPNYPLMLLVFPLGIVTTILFEKYPNIIALGLLHGILGTFAYFMVLGLDPAAELFKAVS